jgi:hypothetical protein
LTLPFEQVEQEAGPATQRNFDNLGLRFPLTSRDIAPGAVGTSEIANGSVADTDLASPNNALYKPLFSATGALFNDAPAGTYVVGNRLDGGAADSSPVNVVFSGFAEIAALPLFIYGSLDYTVAGLTPGLRLRAGVRTNGTASGITFTFGLYPITWSGAADTLTATLGTVVTGSTVAIATPAANSAVLARTTSDITPPADAEYCLGVVTSGTLANNSAVLVSAQLAIHHT